MKEQWGFIAGAALGGGQWGGSAESASWGWSENESARNKRCSLFAPSPVEKKGGKKSPSRNKISEDDRRILVLATKQEFHYLVLSCLRDNRVGSDSFPVSDLELDLVAAPLLLRDEVTFRKGCVCDQYFPFMMINHPFTHPHTHTWEGR